MKKDMVDGLTLYTEVKYNNRLTIIAAYCTCIPHNGIGMLTIHSQQWNIMEE